MTDPARVGNDLSAGTDIEPIDTPDETSEAEQRSRLKRYDKRVEEWLASLKDEAEQRSPEVLSALAAKAKDVAEYLDNMAEKARSKTAPADAASAPSRDKTPDSVNDELSKDPGASVT